MNTDIFLKDGKVVIERACKYCGCVDSILIDGKGPHAAGLECSGCRKHKGWISFIDFQTIKDAINDKDAFDLRKYSEERIEGFE